MEIDRDNLRDVVSYFLQRICALEEELAAHEVLVLWSRGESGTTDAMDILLDHARKSIVLPQHLREKFDQHLSHMANRLVDAMETQSQDNELERLHILDTRETRFVN